MRPVILSLLLCLATCTRSQQTMTNKYWWLGLKKSPFGGRNYNSDEIQRGEHIPQGGRRKSGKILHRSVKQISKRQTEGDSDVLDEVFGDDSQENQIALNDIDTECPRRTTCVERFFCERFSGKNVFDQIPCLLTSGEFAGEFGICCESAFSKVCPSVPVLPDPKDCLLRPLGDPEDDECRNVGTRSSCPTGSLCCFNGCLNVCLEDPPYSVQKAFFFRQKAIIVSEDPKSNPKPSVKGSRTEFQSSGTNGEFGEPQSERDPVTEQSTRSPKLRTARVARVLKRLLSRLRDRIS